MCLLEDILGKVQYYHFQMLHFVEQVTQIHHRLCIQSVETRTLDCLQSFLTRTFGCLQSFLTRNFEKKIWSACWSSAPDRGWELLQLSCDLSLDEMLELELRESSEPDLSSSQDSSSPSTFCLSRSSYLSTAALFASSSSQ